MEMSNYNKNRRGGGNYGNNRRNEPAKLAIEKEQVLSFSESASHELIDQINSYTKNGKISTTQLRKLYNLMRKHSAEQAPILRAKIAYVKARTQSEFRDMKLLLDLVDQSLQAIGMEDKAKYDSLIDFLEAVVSFQRLNGDNNK
jgi:CRISPR type III-A-associated protein Csm2